MEGEEHNFYLKKHVDKRKTPMYSMDCDDRDESQTNMENNYKKKFNNLKGNNNSKMNANMIIRAYRMFVNKKLEIMVEKHHNKES